MAFKEIHWLQKANKGFTGRFGMKWNPTLYVIAYSVGSPGSGLIVRVDEMPIRHRTLLAAPYISAIRNRPLTYELLTYKL
ncbi:hypothetical protein BGP75_08275 [Motiliproteus sp. MSK22-1]|nr:hypothetical protein BGP75_08275 [Motiliproteus sp. MSK22-1]